MSRSTIAQLQFSPFPYCRTSSLFGVAYSKACLQWNVVQISAIAYVRMRFARISVWLKQVTNVLYVSTWFSF